ncbi:MAG: saccharopine dehydrogenase C-terminal domain-containing protein [Bacteroidota bacterium]
MKNILLIGAGRSASVLIKYLLDNSSKEGWKITVGDISLDIAKQKTGNHPNALAIIFDVTNELHRSAEIQKADLVISMLPATMHFIVAQDCLRFKKHLVTASYVSKQMKELNADVKKAGLIFLNEIGLDPGIDHLSAMKIIDEVKQNGGKIITFKSFCGGLVAPESNDNPWGYKFTWNPRSVVTAGQLGNSTGATAQYLEKGKCKYVPYHRLFTNTEIISIDGLGKFEAYPNRDSLSYKELYGLDDVQNMIRGTLRMPGFCRAWNAFIRLGWTDDNCKITESKNMTYSELVEAFLPASKEKKIGLKKLLARFLGEKESSLVMKKLEWLGIFKKEKIKISDASPAEILLNLLMKKWKLKHGDKDMIVMQHEFEYYFHSKEKRKKLHRIVSSLVVKGDDRINTAMAKTVGLPLGMAVKHILNGNINLSGVWIPIVKKIYDPILSELKIFGIKFIEKKYYF